jgi:putative endonuclease
MKFFNHPPVYNKKLSLGKFGEDYVKWFLKNKKYKLLEANYKIRGGEVDVVCQDGETLVFCEVKTRSSIAGGWPEEAVTQTKLFRLTTACMRYIQINRIDKPWRIDVVAVIINDNQVVDVKHYINISSV